MIIRFTFLNRIHSDQIIAVVKTPAVDQAPVIDQTYRA